MRARWAIVAVVAMITGLVCFGLAFGARHLVTHGDPVQYCRDEMPSSAESGGEGQEGTGWALSVLPWGITCEYDFPNQQRVFHDTGTPLLVGSALLLFLGIGALVPAVMQSRKNLAY